ncbi:Isoprenylcysteine carboxyl methyltransferase family-domain-containing protein [Phlebopus sp. FC_14]|nr:Isoprenylcysteine carboxyl methyltransferase family-domain-containing protein [Phlebopus sp. FC_14]
MAENLHDSFERRLQERQQSTHPLATVPTDAQPHGNIPNTPLAVSTISFILGALFSLGLVLFLSGAVSSRWWATQQLGLFVAAWSWFHWAEFAVTAGWNLEKCSVDSFLLDNGAMYHIANGTALAEYLVALYLYPSSKTFPYLSELGVLMVLSGQVLRTTAMVHASTNFSHAVAFRKRESHMLVTDGIYSWFRHPSYAGFFYWALGTQMVLQNPVSFAAFVIILWRFFYRRIRAEEKALLLFFGNDYEVYRRHAGTKIPLIP